MELLDVNLESNPNNNYDVLHDLTYTLKQKYLPKKKKKIQTQEYAMDYNRYFKVDQIKK